MANPELTLFKRVVILSAFAVALVGSVGFLPASAGGVECEGVHDQIARLVRAESRKGLTLELQERIDAIVPLLDDCGVDLVGHASSVPTEIRRWETLVSVFFQEEDVDRALCLMKHESAGDHLARNSSSGASGLMQVMPFWAGHLGYQVDELFDPVINLKIASYIRDEQGWEAWSPFGRGLCQE